MSAPRFVPVPGNPSYEVNNVGVVRRVQGGPGAQAGRVLRQYGDRNGYLRVELWSAGKGKTWLVSRLVCLAFNGAPPSGVHQAAHKNGSRTDNRAENLYWATPLENSRDTILHGTQVHGERSNLAKISDSDARKIVMACRAAPKGEKVATMAAFARRHGVTERGIQQIVYGAVRKRLFEPREPTP